MDTKKLSAMKSLLLRSWRERWPDTYWSIQAKHLVVKGETEQAGLADLLLQQAMVGSSPNLLVLTYFKHAINTQMIEYTVGIESIMKFEDVTKVYCTKALVEVVEGLIPHICSKGNTEDSLRLGKAALKLLYWLLSLIQKCMNKIHDENLSAEYATVITKTCRVLDVIDGNPSLVALLYVVKSDQKDMYESIKELESVLLGGFSNLQSPHITAEASLKLHNSLQVVHKLGVRRIEGEPILDSSHQPLNTSINVLLHIEAILNSTGEISATVQQLLILRKLQVTRMDIAELHTYTILAEYQLFSL